MAEHLINDYNIETDTKDYNFPFDKEEEITTSFYFKFKFLRSQYKLNNSRKNNIDCLVKKIKTKFFKALHEGIKSCLNFNIQRLPQIFITNTNIAYNKKYLKLTIKDIYKEFKIFPNLNEILDTKYIKKSKTELFKVLMNSTLIDTFDSYFKSKMYIYDKQSIEKKGGKKLGKLYDFVANNIFKYYLYSKDYTKKISSKTVINYNNESNN